MSLINNQELSKVRKVEKQLLGELLRVCAENNLKIFADGGTLLGAVREKGFIKDDDDIDLAMPRADYDKLVELSDHFKPPYFLQSAYTDIDYIRPHMQLRMDNTCGALKDELQYVPFHQGIFIDIFPFDGVVQNKFNGKIQWIRIQFYKHFLTFFWGHIPSESKIKAKIKALLHPISRVLNREIVYKKFECLCKKYSANPEYITLLSFNKNYNLRTLNAEWYRGTVYIKFDDITIPVPIEYEKVLTAKFGDWRTPTPGTMHGDTIFSTEKNYKIIREEQNA